MIIPPFGSSEIKRAAKGPSYLTKVMLMIPPPNAYVNGISRALKSFDRAMKGLLNLSFVLFDGLDNFTGVFEVFPKNNLVAFENHF